MLKASRAISKKYKKIRHKKNDELQFIKQIYQCIRNGCEKDTKKKKNQRVRAKKQKTKEKQEDDDYIKFIKEVPLHPRKCLK